MKLSTFMLFITVFNVFGSKTYSQNSRLNLDMKDATIQSVLKAIEGQSEFFFLYSSKMIDVNKKVDINVVDRNVTEVLDELLSGTDIKFAVKDKQILLFSKTADMSMILQQNKITGTITDEKGNPLPGVNVTVKGTTLGTFTDASGKYIINNAPQNATFVFSFIGMTAQEIPSEGRILIDVVLKEEAIGLEEVVVVGYGTQKKATLSGSVASINAEQLKSTSVANIGNALTGQISGLVINTRSGAPGDDSPEIIVRGKGSWNGSAPLIIIDGIANRSGYDRLNINDIESISVLKDASAAIYGSRGANGVILITTKKGKSGKPSFTYEANYGITMPTVITDYVNASQYAIYKNEWNKYLYPNNPPIFSDQEIGWFKNNTGADPDLYPNYDIKDYVLAKYATQEQHELSASGGNENIRYYVSGRYLDQGSFYKKGVDDFTSYNLRSNIDANLTKSIKLSLNIAGRLDKKQNANAGGAIFETMLASPPIKPMFYSNGLPAEINGTNIVEQIQGKAGIAKNNLNLINSQLTLEWQLPFVKGLSFSATGAFDFTNTTYKLFTDAYDVYKYDPATKTYNNLNVNPANARSLNENMSNSYQYTLNYRLGYDKTIGDHDITAFVAYEQYSINTTRIDATRSIFLSDQLPYFPFGGSENQKNTGNDTEFAYRNYFGRLGYVYKKKYIADFTLRRDESLLFPKNNRVGYFPGFSVAWRLSEEPFFKGLIPFADQLKLKASWGQLGSDGGLSSYSYLSMYQLGVADSYSGIAFGKDAVAPTSLAFNGVPNPDVTWEVSNSYNFGIEANLWKKLLEFEFEYFIQDRKNILTQRNASVPSYAGMTLPKENIGKSMLKGVDLSIRHNYNVTTELKYNLGFTFSYAKSKIVYWDEAANIPDYQKTTGYPIDSYLLYKSDGIFNTQAELDATPAKYPGSKVGDIKYVDVNKDGKIDGNDMIRIHEGVTPEITYAMDLGIDYKGISLTVLFQGQANAKQYINPSTRNGDIVVPLWMYNNRWTLDNQEGATMPRAFDNRSETVNEQPSDFWLRDAKYMRLKSLELAYSLPQKLLKPVGLGQCKIFVNGYNLLTFAKMKDYDPENVNQLGIYYPQTRIYNIGLSITF